MTTTTKEFRSFAMELDSLMLSYWDADTDTKAIIILLLKNCIKRLEGID